MRTTYGDRVLIERRLLAALFLWPSECNLEPHHFAAPAHRELYEAIQAVKRQPVADDVLAVTYDDIALAHVALYLLDADQDGLFASEGGFWRFAEKHLTNSSDGRDVIPDLVAEVRECWTCGR